MQASTELDYDIVIVGAGMVGCLLTYAILKSSPTVRIALVDENPARAVTGKHPGFDARSIALSAGSVELLEKLGLWAELRVNAQAIDDIHISDRGGCGMVDLCSVDSQLGKHKQSFGFVVELQDVGAVIDKQLARYTELTRLYDSRLQAIEKYTDKTTCQFENGPLLSCQLVVASDGGDSMTRGLLGIAAQHSDYHCSAIIANLRCSEPHHNKAFERFTEFGPIALLPLRDNRYSLVWSVANVDVDRLSALNDADFLAELQQAFGYRAGIFREVGKRDIYPLTLIQTTKAVTHRGVCVGNAAHSLHPVMGQGFNLGMRDIYVLARVIAELDNNEQIGRFTMLNHYWLARERDHKKTIAMTDSIVRVFANSSLPFIIGRNIALQAMSAIPSLSMPIVKQAKGQFNLFSRDHNA
ncbi:2-octaprenyl-6-methoxyphenyl hydroxylase [Psychromonas sp. MME2]|uniref:2-octaprenyl-6-methoxyphenyl hydroxylase n=1 Tax=unclassified Psychromonas TaxID=2614957 RepID=UPI00339C9E22